MQLFIHVKILKRRRRRRKFVENVWPANSALFIYGQTLCVKTVKQLYNNRYFQLTRRTRGNAPDLLIITSKTVNLSYGVSLRLQYNCFRSRDLLQGNASDKYFHCVLTTSIYSVRYTLVTSERRQTQTDACNISPDLLCLLGLDRQFALQTGCFPNNSCIT